MSQKAAVLVLLALAFAGLMACGDAPDAAGPASKDLAPFAGLEGTLDIAGGTAHIPVMEEAAKRVMKAYPAIHITVAGGGSGVGIQKVGEGLVHIGNAGRALKEGEIAKYPGIRSHAFAIDGVAVIVHPSNPVRELTTDQVRRIFAGEITNWSEVGGTDRGINRYTRDEASGTREVFWEKLLDKCAIARSANVVTSNGAMKTALGADEAGIGYMSIGHLDESVGAVAIDGAAPTQVNAQAGTYRVVRKLYMNTRGELSPLSKAFLDYISSNEGAAITQGAGYIPVR